MAQKYVSRIDGGKTLYTEAIQYTDAKSLFDIVELLRDHLWDSHYYPPRPLVLVTRRGDHIMVAEGEWVLTDPSDPDGFTTYSDDSFASIFELVKP